MARRANNGGHTADKANNGGHTAGKADTGRPRRGQGGHKADKARGQSISRPAFCFLIKKEPHGWGIENK